MGEAFDIQVDRARSGAVVVRVRGRIDGRTASRVLEQGLAVDEPGRGLVLNLGEVTFLSSAGVGALMVLAETVGTGAGGLRLGPVSEPVRAVLGLLNLDQFLSIDASEAEAVRALGA